MSLGKRAVGIGMTVALTASLFGGAVAAQDDKVAILSTQFEPVAEREVMNNVILEGAPPTEYLTVASTGPVLRPDRARRSRLAAVTSTPSVRSTVSSRPWPRTTCSWT